MLLNQETLCQSLPFPRFPLKRHICKKDWKYWKNQNCGAMNTWLLTARGAASHRILDSSIEATISLCIAYIILENHGRITKRHVEHKVLERPRVLLATAEQPAAHPWSSPANLSSC